MGRQMSAIDREDDLSLTVLRHCVARGGGNLSPLQARILHDPLPVRIFSAPTGAGKSYALVRAAAEGRRVLFVVPTRRLAQNLAAAALMELSAGMAAGEAESLVALWSSDETARLRAENPDVKIGRLRVRQTRELGSNARFIVATPESIASMLLGALRPGHADHPFSISDLVANFDHIVFDEFHTIDARGFGLCAVVARAVAATAGGAKLTFLSATPIDVLPVLAALGLPPEAVAVGAEAVVTEAAGTGSNLRALHGDVEIRFCRHVHMLDLLEAHEAALRDCLDRGRQVVVILDSLDTLHAGKRDFAAFFDRLGVSAAKRLAINSVDDGAEPAMDGAFVTDRNADPVDYPVLLATSSVEMGVTFKAGLIAMDAGHDALSFVQRVGRVARNDEPGLVLVRYDAGTASRKSWLRGMLSAFGQEPAPRALTIDRFLEIVLRATRQRFTSAGEFEPGRASTRFPCHADTRRVGGGRVLPCVGAGAVPFSQGSKRCPGVDPTSQSRLDRIPAPAGERADRKRGAQRSRVGVRLSRAGVDAARLHRHRHGGGAWRKAIASAIADHREPPGARRRALGGGREGWVGADARPTVRRGAAPVRKGLPRGNAGRVAAHRRHLFGTQAQRRDGSGTVDGEHGRAPGNPGLSQEAA